MKLINLISVLVLLSGTAAAQTKDTTVTILTSAQCGDCKERIENALNYTKGVKFAELNNDTKVVTVKFAQKKISLKEIYAKINAIGYDADGSKATPAAVEKLPNCCKPGGME
jgi:mercuric ion binding protein